VFVWRLGRVVHDPLSGDGARRVGGRWNPRGVPMVYSSAHLSLAALETLVHTDPELLPDDLVAVQIEVPASVLIEVWEAGTLPPNWRAVPPASSTQRLGAAWAEDRARAGVLSVPSAIIPGERNLLLNPAHPDAARWRVVSVEAFAFDARLLGPRP
jgi:RES domain-containing protein